MSKPGSIFIKHKGESWAPMLNIDFRVEKDMQSFIVNFPEILAGDQIQPDVPLNWIHIASEVPIPHDSSSDFRLDHLFSDQNAVPTFVEDKLENNPDIRKIVAQMLDYAANATLFWTADEVRTRFEQVEGNKTKLINFLGDSEPNVEFFWSRFGENLKNNHARLLFVATNINTDLRRVIEFLNISTVPELEVFGIEIRQYRYGDDTEVMVPFLVGDVARKTRSRSSTIEWTKDDFLDEVSKANFELYDVYDYIIDQMENGDDKLSDIYERKGDSRTASNMSKGSIFYWRKSSHTERWLDLFNLYVNEGKYPVSIQFTFGKANSALALIGKGDIISKITQDINQAVPDLDLELSDVGDKRKLYDASKIKGHEKEFIKIFKDLVKDFDRKVESLVD